MTARLERVAYIGSALTELPESERDEFLAFLVDLGTVYTEVTGKVAFIPHLHCDPKLHRHLSQYEVYDKENPQICERTNLVVVVTTYPSSGMGMEVGWADERGIPQLHISPKLASRLIRGSRAVFDIILYESYRDALEKFRKKLQEIPHIWQEQFGHLNLQANSAQEDSLDAVMLCLLARLAAQKRPSMGVSIDWLQSACYPATGEKVFQALTALREMGYVDYHPTQDGTSNPIVPYYFLQPGVKLKGIVQRQIAPSR